MRRSSLLALVCWLTLSASNSLQACTSPPSEPPPVWVVPGENMGELGQEFWVIFHGYQTFGATPGEFCACGLTIQGVLEGFTVHGVEIIDVATNEPIQGFEFSANENTGTSLAENVGSEAWAGFLSEVTEAIPSGLTVDLNFNVWYQGTQAPCQRLQPRFKRGDANSDGCVDMNDATFINDFLFTGGPAPGCNDAADANGDGSISLQDFTYLANWVQLDGPPPPAPGHERCGCAPNPIGCLSYPQDLCDRNCEGDGGGAALSEEELVNRLTELLERSLVATDEGDETGAVTNSHLEVIQPGVIESMDGMDPEPSFERGDSNGDTRVDIGDGITILTWQFSGGAQPGCLDAADTNDDGHVDIGDAVSTFSYLFLGGDAPPAPGPEDCGVDPTTDSLGCAVSSSQCS